MNDRSDRWNSGALFNVLVVTIRSYIKSFIMTNPRAKTNHPNTAMIIISLYWEKREPSTHRCGPVHDRFFMWADAIAIPASAFFPINSVYTLSLKSNFRWMLLTSRSLLGRAFTFRFISPIFWSGRPMRLRKPWTKLSRYQWGLFCDGDFEVKTLYRIVSLVL